MLDQNLYLWLLQLHQHFDPAIPDKECLIKDVIKMGYGIPETELKSTIQGIIEANPELEH